MNLLILTNPSQNKDYTRIFYLIENLGHNLVGFISMNNDNNFGKIGDYNVYPFQYVHILSYDLALLDCTPDLMDAVVPQLTNVGMPKHKIKTIFWLLQQLMTKKYEDCQDDTIQETLEYWKTNELTVFNQHGKLAENTSDEVYMDETCGLYYINFKTVEDKEKRMYFPYNPGKKAPDGKFYVHNILGEQAPDSPHLYTKSDHNVDYGDVLIDAGVCEGNFALRYVDICSKIYLFEMDKAWFVPLYHTFKEYWDTKVVLVPKAVAENTGGYIVERCNLSA